MKALLLLSTSSVSILPFFSISPLSPHCLPKLQPPQPQVPLLLLRLFTFLPSLFLSPMLRDLSLYLSLLHYFSLSLNISLLIFLSFLFPLSVTLRPSDSSTLVSGCCVVFKCKHLYLALHTLPLHHSLFLPFLVCVWVCVAIWQSESPYKHTSALPLMTTTLKKHLYHHISVQ